MTATVTVTFIPQIWEGRDRDYTINVKPLGPAVWQVPVERVANIHPGTYEADELAREPEAPEWVQQWVVSHPFEVDWVDWEG